MRDTLGALGANLMIFADTSDAIKTVREWVIPTVQSIASLASIAAVLILTYAGYIYMTSTGNPKRIELAKNIAKKAAIGLVIILSAITLASLISNAYSAPQNPADAAMPKLQAIKQKNANNGLIEMVITTVTGFLLKIVNDLASPFLGALDFFTRSTPIMANNKSVFNFWLAIVGIADVLFILVLALIGFHVMSASALGFAEINLKTISPRLLLIFALMNSSIFLIDGIIALSNVLVKAVGQISGADSVWMTLTGVVENTSGLGLAALIIMIAFVFFAVVLLVYYVMRLVTLYLGAVLSPVVILLWLLPGFHDFAETSFKTYLTTIFVLFVHVVILQLSASLFAGMAVVSGGNKPDTLMAMVTGIATIVMILKAQSTMMQFSYVSIGSRNIKKLSGTFINGVSHLTANARSAVNTIRSRTDAIKKTHMPTNTRIQAVRASKIQNTTYDNKRKTAPKSKEPTIQIIRTPSRAPSKDRKR